MITARQKRFVALALVESGYSTYDRVRIGAVIARRNRVISKGANLRTSHPLQKLYNDKVGRLAPMHACHAEMHAIINAREDLTGADIYVGRWDRKGRVAMCKPCVACSKAIKDVGIKSITYTTEEGIKHEDYN